MYSFIRIFLLVVFGLGIFGSCSGIPLQLAITDSKPLPKLVRTGDKTVVILPTLSVSTLAGTAKEIDDTFDRIQQNYTTVKKTPNVLRSELIADPVKKLALAKLYNQVWTKENQDWQTVGPALDALFSQTHNVQHLESGKDAKILAFNYSDWKDLKPKDPTGIEKEIRELKLNSDIVILPAVALYDPYYKNITLLLLLFPYWSNSVLDQYRMTFYVFDTKNGKSLRSVRILFGVGGSDSRQEQLEGILRNVLEN
ncbi:hypothetical protein CH373_09455 [Leptospira perolatii]|uniref:Lipoprotein n=1 Tax=Leptospira perolatii TaxID=2023191 RepID=A0A2M9ZMA7_9LEPT|nr:hypothetical protein [Leptospira perolatii]PJZ68509.1 hypothetical protein CH360_15955 [Leptospira perolatii]PJZ73206.1 hypothetical protein CH373_09455 [Leptospira perolatii]